MSATPADASLTARIDAGKAGALGDLFKTLLPAPDTGRLAFTAPVLLFAALGKDGQTSRFGQSHHAPTLMTVQEAQTLCQNAPLAAGECYTITSHVHESGRAGGGYGFSAEISDARGRIHTSMRTTLRDLEIADIHRIKGTPLPGSVTPESLSWVASNPVSRAALEQYLALSGDRNPIHHDETHARAMGFAGVIAPGMLTAGLLENALLRTCPSCILAEARIRFMSPIAPGESLRFAVQTRGDPDAQGTLRTRVFVTRQDEALNLIADCFLKSA